MRPMSLPFKNNLLESPRIPPNISNLRRLLINHDYSIKEYTPFAIIPIILIISVISLVIIICRLYQWNVQRTQYEYLSRIYDILEESSPLQQPSTDYKTQIRLHRAVCIPCEPSPFFQPRTRRQSSSSYSSIHINHSLTIPPPTPTLI